MMEDLDRVDIAVPGGHLAVRFTDARGAGMPLVFLHGGGLDHRMWTGQVATFGGHRRTVLVDARGHGDSATATAAYRHCDDLAAALRQLHLGPAIVVGLSMGGGTDVDLALEHPDLVAGLLVSGTGTSEPTFTDPWVLDVFTEWKVAEQTRDPERWLDAFLRFVPGPFRSLDEVDPDVVERVRQMGSDTLRNHATRAFVEPIPVTGTWQRVPSLSAPVVVVGGVLDSPDHLGMGHRLADAVPDGRAVDIRDSGHYPNLEQPAEFDAAVELLIARVER